MNSSGKRKTVFLDRDGVINVDRGYVFKVEDFEFFPDTLLALKTLQDRGYQIIIITNQSGIARGFYTVRQYKNLTSYYLKQFKRYGIKNVKVLFCPHHPNAKIKKYKKECNCRKPGIALFEKAIKKYMLLTKRWCLLH